MPEALSPWHEAFGRAVRQLRDESGLTQETLGQKTGLHRNYIGGVERGELNPSLTNIRKLAEGVERRTSELVALAEALEI